MKIIKNDREHNHPISYRGLLTNPEKDGPLKALCVFIHIGPKDNITVTLVELAVHRLLNLVGKEVFNFPDSDTWNLTHILVKELMVVEGRTLQGLIPTLLAVGIRDSMITQHLPHRE